MADEPTGPAGESTDRPSARSIQGDHGSYVLAATEEDARAFAEAEGYTLGADVGWMVETWDYDTYETREEFLEQSGYESWWMGCTNPGGQSPSEHLLRAWEATAA